MIDSNSAFLCFFLYLFKADKKPVIVRQLRNAILVQQPNDRMEKIILPRENAQMKQIVKSKMPKLAVVMKAKKCHVKMHKLSTDEIARLIHGSGNGAYQNLLARIKALPCKYIFEI